MATLNIRIDDEMTEALERMAQQQQRTKSDLVREMLRKRLAVERFRALRGQAMPFAQAAGFVTDEDVFGDSV